jgi:para-aminobenzoate synthetase/4-amino-4-deoxychorismate lyase
VTPDADRSLGVFETLLVRDRRVQALDAHVQRLRRSAHRLYGLSAPPELPARIRAHAATLDAGEHRLRVDARPAAGEHRRRVDARPAAGELQLTFTTTPLAPRAALWRLTPLPVAGGYGPDKLVDRGPLTSSAAGAPVPLLVDGAGREADVLEAAWANVWLIDGERLITPPCDGRILPGVTRARVLDLAGTAGVRVDERPITLTEARAAPLMLTSSLQLAAPAALAGAPPPPADATELVARIRSALLSSGWE